MAFSIIIPSKTASNLVPCIQAIARNEPDLSPEKIIVVDDGVDLTDAEKAASGCWFVQGVKPFVFARNCNIGIRAAGTDDVILLNDDALLQDRGGFTKIAQIVELGRAGALDDIGIIGATTNLTGQPLQWRQDVGLRVVPHFAFICVYIPRRTIDRVGMLDERYCIDYGVEDLDYCEAVNRAGLKCAVYDGCYVDHGSLVSSFRGDPKTPRSFSENYKLFQQKWGIA